MAEYIIDTTDGILHARTTGELVRCKDCAYHDERGYMPGRVTCRMHSGIWGKDDFCSKAEKKED
jgi:hypothetical protein